MELKKSFVDNNQEDLEDENLKQAMINNSSSQLKSFDEIDSNQNFD